MGLCKCERKRVTNLFCFEHRVNVCEFCLVSNHNKCIVKSYLRWLKDSDFNPSCPICHEKFETDCSKECVRLVCLDVFHWDCLDYYVKSLPATTTPAGYLCPICGQSIIPRENHGGPVAEALREVLQRAEWSKAEFVESPPFSLASTKHSTPPFVPNQRNVDISTQSCANGKLLDPRLDLAARQFLRGQDVIELIETSRDNGISQTSVKNENVHQQESYIDHQHQDFQDQCQRRDQPLSPFHPHIRTNFDEDDKYKRRSPISWFIRFLKGHSSSLSHPFAFHKRRTLVLLFLILLFIFSLIYFGSRGTDSSGDPLLDPHMNPNIHLDEQSLDELHAILHRKLNDPKQPVGNLKEA